jgi:hypothetical protein
VAHLVIASARYLNFLMTKQALWPPKPKLFDKATST